jgi:hypothetical protein
VTFNDHEGSTKSYLYTRRHEARATESDYVPKAAEILAELNGDGVTSVTMHDGSVLRFRTVPSGYDPTDRQRVMAYLQERQAKGEVVTGVLYLDETVPDLHEMNNTPEIPLTEVAYEKLCPGATGTRRAEVWAAEQSTGRNKHSQAAGALEKCQTPGFSCAAFFNRSKLAVASRIAGRGDQGVCAPGGGRKAFYQECE